MKVCQHECLETCNIEMMQTFLFTFSKKTQNWAMDLKYLKNSSKNLKNNWRGVLLNPAPRGRLRVNLIGLTQESLVQFPPPSWREFWEMSLNNESTSFLFAVVDCWYRFLCLHEHVPCWRSTEGPTRVTAPPPPAVCVQGGHERTKDTWLDQETTSNRVVDPQLLHLIR